MIEDSIRASIEQAKADGVHVEEEKKGEEPQEQVAKEKMTSPEDRIILYFHGNAEDLFHNLYFLNQIKEFFGCSVMAMEYPGYGFFKNQIKNETI